MTSRRLKIKTAILLVVMVVFGPLGDIVLSKGMRALGPLPGVEPGVLSGFLVRAFESGTVWLAICSLSVFFISYLLVLSWADFSFVQPATSLGYGMVALLGYFLLGESISLTRWLGVSVICLGVLMIGQTPPRTTEPKLKSAIAVAHVEEIG
jgi:uncharacterized membrane protein